MIPGESDKPFSETARTNCAEDSNRGGISSGDTAEKVTSNRIDSIKRLASNHGSVKILGSVRNKTTGNIDILDFADTKEDGNNDDGVKAEVVANVNNRQKKEWTSVLLRSGRSCRLFK